MIDPLDPLPDPLVVVPDPAGGEQLERWGVQRNFEAIRGVLIELRMPPGVILPFGGPTAPSGWLMCSGQSVTVANYPRLFEIIGYAYGGAGANFNVPHMHERFPMGASASFALGATGGSATHTLTEGEMPVHDHPVTDPGHKHMIQKSGAEVAATGAGGIFQLQENSGTNYANTQSATTGVTVGDAGGGQPHNNLPPYLVVNFIIRT